MSDDRVPHNVLAEMVVNRFADYATAKNRRFFASLSCLQGQLANPTNDAPMVKLVEYSVRFADELIRQLAEK